MRLLHFNAEDKRRIDMAKKIDRAWKYFKCQKCGKEGLTDSVNGVIECKCKNKVYYDESLEEQWLNAVNEKGERIRLDFKGSDEQDCRRQAANYFNCKKEDITNYYIVQKSGLFKKFIICADRPVESEKDPNAVKIIMWEYEGRPSIWLDINRDDKSILYPYEMGNEKIHYESIKGMEYNKENTMAGTWYFLDLEPQGRVSLSFYPGYEKNFLKLLDLIKDDIPKLEHGMFTEEFFTKSEFDPSEIAKYEDVDLQIESDDFNYRGYLSGWKNESELCFCNSITRVGYRFPLDKIKYYRLLGQKYVTTKISGGGGGGSLIKGAVIGGLIAGEAGAVIGSRKEVNDINGISTVHDEQTVLLYDISLKQVVQFNSAAYEVFTKLIPEKEYEVVLQESESSKGVNFDDIDALEKLANLFEKGILTKEEFESKKKEILSRV